MDIYQVKGRHVNSYVVEDDKGLLVVDVAWHGEKYVLGFIREVLNREPEDVNLVICTHGDPDHSGGISNMAKICNAQLGVPYATQSALLKFINDPTGIVFRLSTMFREGIRPRAWAMYANPKRDARARALPTYLPESTTEPELELQDQHEGFGGKVNFRLKNHTALPIFNDWMIIHSPGHSWDSCCFYHQKSGTLISGDTLLGSGKKGHVVAPSVYSNPIQMARTIKSLKQLNPKAIYPGHGSFFEGENLLEHLY